MASTSKACNKITGYLKKIIGAPVGEIFSLTAGEVIIGRNRQTAQILIQDPNISRSHCVLKYNENSWLIKDLKSVNGTFLEGKVLDPELFYPLKDGAGIYLGPPGEAPVAFIFLTKMSNEQSGEINVNGSSQRNRGETTRVQVLVSNKSNNCMKRQSDAESSATNGGFSQRKKIATSSVLPVLSSRVQDICEPTDESDLSDCSISSLDSLKTRVRKMSAKKEKKSNSRNKDNINSASTSASPQLRSANYASLESKPSTSAIPGEIVDAKRNKVKKPAISKEFALLNTLFNESESSTPDTIKGDDDSQSLLNDSKILIDCEPYPFSQPLPPETAQEKKNKDKSNREPEKKDSVEEQLQQATLELKKLKKDKVCLKNLVKELRSEESLKKKFQVEFQKMIEDELMCNICTEVFMKAITLGCSHTFCEYCICEWKKKQKKCPICREKIASETKILVLDSFINKAVEQLDIETQKRRNELAITREKAKATQQKKKGKQTRGRGRGRGRQIHSDSSDGDEINNIGEQIFDVLFQPNNSPSVEVVHDDLDAISSDFSDISDESDMSVEGYGYFGGYGRCYNCGRRGHWANGCPY